MLRTYEFVFEDTETYTEHKVEIQVDNQSSVRLEIWPQPTEPLHMRARDAEEFRSALNDALDYRLRNPVD